MIASRTIASAANAARVSERQAFRYWAEPGVREEVEQRRAVAFEQGGVLLKALFGSAVERLGELTRSKDAEIACRASRAVVELGLRFESGVVVARQVAEQERRLVALEALAGRPGRRAA